MAGRDFAGRVLGESQQAGLLWEEGVGAECRYSAAQYGPAKSMGGGPREATQSHPWAFPGPPVASRDLRQTKAKNLET